MARCLGIWEDSLNRLSLLPFLFCFIQLFYLFSQYLSWYHFLRVSNFSALLHPLPVLFVCQCIALCYLPWPAKLPCSGALLLTGWLFGGAAGDGLRGLVQAGQGMQRTAGCHLHGRIIELG